MKDIFSKDVSSELIARIDKLKPETKSLWGKMNVAQMLAHCNVTYEMIYDDIHPKPNAIIKFMLKLLVKPKVVSENPYPKSDRTAPQFVITGDRDFDKEKKRLIDYINKSQQEGTAKFEGRESNSFGRLTSIEWNNMLYKHLDHHLRQFGV